MCQLKLYLLIDALPALWSPSAEFHARDEASEFWVRVFILASFWALVTAAAAVGEAAV